jgi:hypothetical protein
MKHIVLKSTRTGYQAFLKMSDDSQTSTRLPPGYDTILNNGDPACNFDILFIGDNYSLAEMSLFRNDVNANMTFLLSRPPYDEYYDNINVHLIENTLPLGCYTNCGGIPQMICCNDTAVFGVAAAAPYDEIIVLYNTDTYGGGASVTPGGGGPETYAAAYHNTSDYGEEVTVHEFGHSFGGLMDEYSYGVATGTPYGPNCDYLGCPAWKTVPGAGCYRKCAYDNLFRSTDGDCVMQTLYPTSGYFYCNVCKRQLVSLLSAYKKPVPISMPSVITTMLAALTSMFLLFAISKR